LKLKNDQQQIMCAGNSDTTLDSICVIRCE